MNVKTNKGNYVVKFYHDTEESRYTDCSVEFESGEKWMSAAYCAPEDNFSRSLGRKLSLTRVLAQMTGFGEISPEDRSLFWAAYFQNHSDKARPSNIPWNK